MVTKRIDIIAARVLNGLAAAVLTMAAALIPVPAISQTSCSSTDSDGDGFTDAQECAGITTIGTIDSQGLTVGVRTIPPCPPSVTRDQRRSCVDPNSKDLFVIYLPLSASSGGYLADGPTAVPEPFSPVTAYGLTFEGFSALGVTLHRLGVTEAPLDTRRVTDVSDQKAVLVFEDLDPTGETFGDCPWGTPNRLDGGTCIIFTQRIWNFINQTCAGKGIVTASGAQSNAADVFRAYATETILHEVGHSSGGLASKFDSRYGGYHYGYGTIMEESVYVNAKRTCKFSISNQWNLTLDPSSIKLK